MVGVSEFSTLLDLGRLTTASSFLDTTEGLSFLGHTGKRQDAALRVMASHPHIRAFSLDLSDAFEKSSDVSRVFEKSG
jgi:hypothetical protein